MTDTDRTFQMSVKTTNYILLVVCSSRSNTKRESVLEIGLVCCFIPIHIAGWRSGLPCWFPLPETHVQIVYPRPVEYIE